MLLQVSIIYIFFEIIQISFCNNDEGLELLFRERSHNDWKDVWHQESHSRCRDKLVKHLYWACEKDIYRLTRRNNLMTSAIANKRNKGFPWLDINDSISILQTRRLKKNNGKGSKGITAECCTKIGCTWEEYAEYCPSNKRKNHNRN